MKIIEKKDPTRVQFRDVEVGDVFQCNALTAIKTAHVTMRHKGIEHEVNAVDLSTGCFCNVGSLDECVVKSATLVLE